jgi:hypothetical protein
VPDVCLIRGFVSALAVSPPAAEKEKEKSGDTPHPGLAIIGLL